MTDVYKYDKTTLWINNILHMIGKVYHSNAIQGSYRQVHVKFKEFSRTSKRLSYHLQGLKNTDLHIKIPLLRRSSEMLESIIKDISLRKSV